ncbi:protein toll-like [Octopus sinensis]|uniref:Protein toll-like n=1 Tax=Octopus sinensis TaxID=2607531 RepID=A0A6P7S5Q3_9MOLL|nr:protein toll-like [Octopus sinensis]
MEAGVCLKIQLLCSLLSTCFFKLIPSNQIENNTFLCIYGVRKLSETRLFSIDGKLLETTARAFVHINTTSSENECVIELKHLNIPRIKIRILIYFFSCSDELTVRLDTTDVETMPRNILYLQIQSCLMSQEDVGKLESLYDLRVLTYFKTIPSSAIWSGNNETDNVKGIDNVVSYNIQADRNYSSTLPWVLTANRTYPTIAELSLSGIGLTEFPDEMRIRFPNLQSLEIPNNKLIEIPKFPYTEETYKLPLGLSRTPYMQNHYAEVFGIKVKPNYFRRILNLNGNQITNLSDNCTSGFLQVLFLEKNGVVNISDHALSSIYGLDTLTLENNLLIQIGEKQFSYCKDLQSLNLKFNKISWIHSRAFRHNKNLLKLDLSNNKLVSLEEGIFTALDNMKTLNLEYNQIQNLSCKSLPLSSIKLEEINLRNNTLETLPICFFLIRTLKQVDLSFNQIAIGKVSILLGLINSSELIHSVVYSASSSVDLYRKPKERRLIDLSYNQIHRLDFSNFTESNHRTMVLILLNFELRFTGNLIECDCHLLPLLDFFITHREKHYFDGSEYFYHKWRCDSPSEFKNTPILSLKKEQLYCSEAMLHCPTNCMCYRRLVQKTVIVDCRHRKITVFPLTMPDGKLEVWLQFNNITKLVNRPYLSQITHLNLTKNSITSLNHTVMRNMVNLKQMILNWNLLTTLPKEIQYVQFEVLNINNNHFFCDCTNIWLKKWLQKSRESIVNWRRIVCNTVGDKVLNIVEVPNDKFICNNPNDNFNKTLTLGLSLALAILILLVCLFLFIHYWLEIKVILYVYLNIRPFDSNPQKIDDDLEPIDTLIVYSKSLSEWATENIIKNLEKLSFNVLDTNRDLLIGMSFQENIRVAVSRSKYSIIVLSEESIEDSLVQIALSYTYEKTLSVRPTYIILILHDIKRNIVKNKNLKKYLHSGRFINSTDHMMEKKLFYMLTGRNLYNNHDIPLRRRKSYKVFFPEVLGSANTLNEQKKYDIFISYPDQTYKFATGPLLSTLQSRGYSICLPDRDFVVGSAKEENILKAIKSSIRTLIVITESHVEDEWQLFTLRTAVQCSLKKPFNYLLCILDCIEDKNKLDPETQAYVTSHVVIDKDDPLLWKKLFRSIPPARTVENSTPSFDSRKS